MSSEWVRSFNVNLRIYWGLYCTDIRFILMKISAHIETVNKTTQAEL